MLGFNRVSNKDLFYSKTLVDIYLKNKCKYLQIYLSLCTSIIFILCDTNQEKIIKISKYSLFKKHERLFFLLYVWECFACLYIGILHAFLVPEKTKEGSDPQELDFMDGCELPCGCREPNPSCLQKQQVLLSWGDIFPFPEITFIHQS